MHKHKSSIMGVKEPMGHDGDHSHSHHKKMHDHHMSEAKKHAGHLHKMAKGHKAPRSKAK